SSPSGTATNGPLAKKSKTDEYYCECSVGDFFRFCVKLRLDFEKQCEYTKELEQEIRELKARVDTPPPVSSLPLPLAPSPNPTPLIPADDVAMIEVPQNAPDHSSTSAAKKTDPDSSTTPESPSDLERSIVIARLPFNPDRTPEQQVRDDFEQVVAITSLTGYPVLPIAVYRMPPRDVDAAHMRLTKVVLPTRQHAKLIVKNASRVAQSDHFREVFIRPSYADRDDARRKTPAPRSGLNGPRPSNGTTHPPQSARPSQIPAPRARTHSVLTTESRANRRPMNPRRNQPPGFLRPLSFTHNRYGSPPPPLFNNPMPCNSFPPPLYPFINSYPNPFLSYVSPYANCRSIRNKLQYLSQTLSKKYTIICLTETWLSPSFPNSLLLGDQDQYYNVFRRDRNSRGGGVAIILHSSISAAQIADETVPESNELLAVDVDINGDLIWIVCAYRNPKASTTQTVSLVKSILDLCSCPQPTIVTGDFNLPDIDWSIFPAPQPKTVIPSSQSFIDFCNSAKLVQLVKEPTRKENILDLLLCNHPGLITQTGVGPPFDISDHSTVEFNFTMSHSTPAFTLRRDYRKADYDLINSQLANIDWTCIFSKIENIDLMYDLLISVIQKSIDTHVPWAKVSLSQGKLPPHIERLLGKRFQAWQISINSNDPNDQHEFENLNKKFRKELQRYHKTIEKKVIESDDKNKFFRFMKRCANKSKGVEGLTRTDGSLIMDDLGKANLLAETFASVFTIDDGKLPNSQGLLHLGNYEEPQFLRHEICSLIEKWKRSSCKTPENIDLTFIKRIAVPISEALEIIFRNSYQSGTVPSHWRHSIVTPVKKSPPFSNPLNYRPISITSFFCRVFERILCKSIITHSHKCNSLHLGRANTKRTYAIGTTTLEQKD
ncbi:hypothetical protein PMAYCL1PPCAC_23840, partial [Pristionchus mayeri]